MAWRNDAGLVGRVVIVTGAGGGIGRAVCQALDEAGSLVLAVDVSSALVDSVLNQLKHPHHSGFVADLSDLSTHAAIFGHAQQMGDLAALVHLAAVLVRRASVDEVTEEDWDRQHNVNLKSTFFLNRAAKDAFVTQGSEGSIVNFTSQGWWTGGFGGSVAYAASKGGIVSLTKGLARSFAPLGIRVNAVSPGGVDTMMMTGTQTKEELSDFVSMIPLGRLATPDELTGAVLFLASDASAYVTGSVMNVSGGQLMY